MNTGRCAVSGRILMGVAGLRVWLQGKTGGAAGWMMAYAPRISPCCRRFLAAFQRVFTVPDQAGP